MFQQRNEKGAFRNLFHHMNNNDQEMFFKYTRMLPETFDSLLNLLKRHLLKRSRREYLSPELRLAMTLKYLAHGGSFPNLSWEFRVGHSTVSKIIFETCEAIWNVLKPIYVKSHDEIDWLQVSNQFLHRWDFPHTLGAIDGKHVQIQCPINSGSQYYNYKNHFSMVLLACCDADYKFLWVDIGGSGSEHDSGVFRRSQMGQDLENGIVKLPDSQNLHGSNIEMPFFFVADEAFPLKSYIMRPYSTRTWRKKICI
uniref:Protein ALP1-like n=1 Tax=Diabrotica virgifera virgifera TaxID=50390 RepID=A0A6P7GJI6_DIAVI